MKVMTGSKPVVRPARRAAHHGAYSYASRVIGQIRGGLLPNPRAC
jgi:hypothetical protein